MTTVPVSPPQEPQGANTTVRLPNRVVVGVDFSEVSLATAQWVARHLGLYATLTLVHVVNDPLLPNVSQRRSRQQNAEGLFRTRLRSLRGALRGLADVVGGQNTEIQLRVGDPALQLASYADIVDADLVVVGGNSNFHAAPRHETATTDRLLRHLTQAALVVRNRPVPPKSVLAVFTPDVAAPVLDFAHLVAIPSKAHVTTLRLSGGRGSRSLKAADSSVLHMAARGGTKDSMLPNEQVRMILDVARAQRAEVIAIGSSAAARGVDDDIARVLARTAACSVLVVPQSARTRRDSSVPMTRWIAQSVAVPNEPDAAPA